MRPSRVFERLAVNAKDATHSLGFYPSILRHRESEGKADKAVLKAYIKEKIQKTLLKYSSSNVNKIEKGCIV
jgi:hypothetical protein